MLDSEDDMSVVGSITSSSNHPGDPFPSGAGDCLAPEGKL